MPHADNANFSGLTKEDSYEQLLMSMEGLLTGNWVADLANAASLLWHHFKEQPVPYSQVNWAGFYVTNTQKADELILGPFQGKVACQFIDFGRGVCGAAAKEQKTQLVPRVEDFPGHIACDGDTKSEIVVPIVGAKRLLGVIDIDCTSECAFDGVDQLNLEKLAALLAPSLERNLIN